MLFNKAIKINTYWKIIVVLLIFENIIKYFEIIDEVTLFVLVNLFV